ncbi:hypothetical protein P43SY_009920 [Pythium insidiosum]|uniref:t-SNARE coiled-coil homology domain-containing protein n=1 Tax=Pythium insidiosum TaxID=114742 RepID=A0AAD5M2Q7_PYTIN|nr:hypothetical protein P43SY_009920 [Pythium insidiosum]
MLATDRTRDFERLVAASHGATAARDVVRSAFLSDAAELMQSLAGLEALLEKTARAYVQPQLFLRLKARDRMTEQQKDEFDARLKALASASKRLQKRRHELAFVRSHRLLPEDARLALADREEEILRAIAEKAKAKTAVRKPKKDENPALLSTRQATSPAMAPATAAPQQYSVRGAPLFASQEEAVEFTESQERHFRMENLTLQRHFQENLEDAKQMEAKMAEISSLMGQFADKIMEQQSEIELIHQHAQETKTNVKQSNKILEQTQQIGRGYGFMIFCIYLAFSLLLHALHYFNR